MKIWILEYDNGNSETKIIGTFSSEQLLKAALPIYGKDYKNWGWFNVFWSELDCLKQGKIRIHRLDGKRAKTSMEISLEQTPASYWEGENFS